MRIGAALHWWITGRCSASPWGIRCANRRRTGSKVTPNGRPHPPTGDPSTGAATPEGGDAPDLQTRKCPTHQVDGIGHSHSVVLPEQTTARKRHPQEPSCSCSLQRSHSEPLASVIQGTYGIAPMHSTALRSQDGPPVVHRIGASFWILPEPQLLRIRRGAPIGRSPKS